MSFVRLGVMWSVVLMLGLFGSPSSAQATGHWALQRIGEPEQQDEYTLRAPVISPDARRVAASDGSALRLRDAASGEAIGRPMMRHRGGGVSVAAWAPDSRTIATGGYDGLLVLWDAEKHEALWAVPTGHEHVHAIAWSADGARIATGGKKNGSIRVWERATGRALGAALVGHSKEVWGIAFAADGKTLVSAGLDGTIRTWDAHAGVALRTIQTGFANGPRQLVLHPKLPIAAVGSHDLVALWNIETGAAVAGVLKGLRAGHGMSGLAFNEEGTRLMSADSAGGVALIDWRGHEWGQVLHYDIAIWA